MQLAEGYLVLVSHPVDLFLGNQRSPAVLFDLFSTTCLATEYSLDRIVVLVSLNFFHDEPVAPEILILF